MCFCTQTLTTLVNAAWFSRSSVIEGWSFFILCQFCGLLHIFGSSAPFLWVKTTSDSCQRAHWCRNYQTCHWVFFLTQLRFCTWVSSPACRHLISFQLEPCSFCADSQCHVQITFRHLVLRQSDTSDIVESFWMSRKTLSLSFPTTHFLTMLHTDSDESQEWSLLSKKPESFNNIRNEQHNDIKSTIIMQGCRFPSMFHETRFLGRKQNPGQLLHMNINFKIFSTLVTSPLEKINVNRTRTCHYVLQYDFGGIKIAQRCTGCFVSVFLALCLGVGASHFCINFFGHSARPDGCAVCSRACTFVPKK